jgi:hypothetical protein
MATPDRSLVLAARITGVAAGYAHVKRCTRAEALTEVADILASARAKPGSPRAVALLTSSASFYVGSTGAGDQWWYAAALAFLVDAGANVAEAARIK